MSTQPHSARRALEAFVSRLIQSVARGPLIKGFPTKTVKRIDLDRLRVASADAPERLVEALIGPAGQLLLRFEHFASSGAVGDESRALFATLKSKLQREAQMVLRETGLRTLWLAYPTLFVPNPAGDASDFLLAPLFLWPLRMIASDLGEGEIILARDKDGGAPRFNRVATAWIRRYLDFAPAEPTLADIREIESMADVEAACAGLAASFRPPLGVALTGRVAGVPRRDELLGQTTPALLNSGLIGLVQWENQELIQDLERLLAMEQIEGAADDFLRDPGPKSASAAAPEEADRYLVTDTDASQERAVWMARGEQGVVVHGPPGTGKSQVIVNIVADALAHHKTVLVVCQKKAALDVVAARLRARGLGDLCLQVDDVESDRARVIEALKTQRRPEIGPFEQERRSLADTITRVETELDGYRRALFDLRQSHGLSYRRMLGRIATLRSQAPEVEVPDSLRPLVSGLRYAEVQRLGRLFEELGAVHAQVKPTENPWRHARPEVGGTPDERAAIERTLRMLEIAATSADGGATAAGDLTVDIRGDLVGIVEAAVEMRHGVSALRPTLRRPPRRGVPQGQALLVDGRLRTAVVALRTLLRWQDSAFRRLVPEYHLARRRFRQVVRGHPWLAEGHAAETLEQVTQRARVVHTFCRTLAPFSEWLEDGCLLEIETAARRGDPVAPTVEAFRDWLLTLPLLSRYRAMVNGLATSERQVLDVLLRDSVSDQWSVRIELAALSSWVREAEQDSPILRAMAPELYEARRGELQTVLARKRELEAKAIAAAWGDKWEGTDLRWRQGLVTRGRASRRLREIVEAWRQGLMVMRPCWLMTPGTVSQLCPLEPGMFDMVVFDEASQCPPEYAIPSLYRGRRAVVAGDAKQLPPTMFFKSTFDFEEGEEDNPEEATEAGEILDRHAYAVTTGTEDLLALAQARLPEAHLNVHYRSRDPRLIAFSNAAFYGNQLQAPQGAAPVVADGGPALSLVRVDGRYSRSRVNDREAEAVVGCIRSLWAAPGPAPTLGVVTFNEPQQQRILDLLDELARTDTAFRARYSHELARKDDGQDVGFFVKNLEAVQGDERDVMLFSTTYGPQDDRPFSRAFLGPLNQTGGERRLNVAITRAKLWVRIFTSLPIEQIADALTGNGVPATGGLGRSMLQLYLAYAEAVTRGAEDVATVTLERALEISGYVTDPAESLGLEESEFELEVADQLRRRFGYRVDPQVGSGAFRIDLGVRHPEDSGAYVLGVECDGRAYHSAPSARAYDLWRQRILEERGWRIHRIWSTAWRQDPERELEKIERVIRERLAAASRSRIRWSEVSPEDRHGDGTASGHELAADTAAGRQMGSLPTEVPELESRQGVVVGREAGSSRGAREETSPPTAPVPRKLSKPRPAAVTPPPTAALGRAPTSHVRDGVTTAIARHLPGTAWSCGKCGEGLQLWMGRFGPFLKCTAPACGQNVRVETAILAKVLQDLGVTCAACAARAVAARGPFGNFIGCSDYPRCKARRSWLELRDEMRRET